MRVLEMVANPNLIPLGTAIPDSRLLPIQALGRSLARVARSNSAGAVASVAPSGVEALRREIARRALDAGSSVTADEVVVTCGCAEAIALCLRATTKPGDAVVVESPAYFGTLQAVDALGLRALEIPVDPTVGMSLEALADALQHTAVAVVVVTPNVHNPLGCIMPDERKQRLVDLVTDRGIPLIEDDTYGDLYFGERRPRSLRAFDRSRIVLSCGSFSKTIAPGFRVGWTIPVAITTPYFITSSLPRRRRARRCSSRSPTI
jgi:DNA-binding transcriptional MocR family regulator